MRSLSSASRQLLADISLALRRLRRAPLFTLTAVGVFAAGVVAAVLFGFVLRARNFYALQPLDAFALVGVVAVLTAAGFVSTVLPFHRLLRRDAAAMLREE